MPRENNSLDPSRTASHDRRTDRRTGFTLVELLVVIGIIALLISILLPSLNRAREQAKRVQCLSNLKQAGNAMLMYANQNKGRLPMHHGGGNWLWDVPIQTRDILLGNGGLVRQTLYCPTAVDRDVAGLWDFVPNSFMVAGYFFLHKRHPNVPGPAPTPGPWPALPPTLAAPLGHPPKEYQDRLNVKQASDKELVLDAQLSQPSGGVEDFYTVVGGFKVLPDHSNHIKGKGSKPYGGNILYLDGHGEWRDFSFMLQRANAGDVKFWF
jgi:prepilin-type N-terminal cleavage/methylation domain-containing protein/prepilin-type processing-associated H-X9-DG protein